MTVLLKPKQGGRPIVLDKPIVLIGRHPECDVTIEVSQKISRKHCFVAVSDNRCYVRDLESMNGVWVNGRRVTDSTLLRLGDELMIGDVPFELVKSVAASREKQPPKREPEGASETQFRSGEVRPEKKDGDNTLDEGDPHAAFQFDGAFNFPDSAEESGEDFMIPIAELDE